VSYAERTTFGTRDQIPAASAEQRATHRHLLVPHVPDFHGSSLFAIVMLLITLYASAPDRSVPPAPKQLRTTIVSSVPVGSDGKGADRVVVVLSHGSRVTARYRGRHQLYKGQSVRVTETVGDGDALYVISEPKSLLD